MGVEGRVEVRDWRGVEVMGVEGRGEVRDWRGGWR